MHRIFDLPFATVYPLYIKKVERKGQSIDDMNRAIQWLTGFTQEQIDQHVAAQTTFRQLFEGATIHENSALITGTICGVKVQDIDDPLMQKIRYLDKLVDEVANGRPMSKILR